MKRIAVLSVAVLALAACSDAPTAVLQPEIQLANVNAAEQVTVLVTATVTVGSGEPTIITNAPGVLRDEETGQVVGTLGWCGPTGQWQNPSGEWATPVPHPGHCVLPAGQVTLQVTFMEGATLASQGRNLNFADFEGQARSLHYNDNQNRTLGQGTIYGADDQGGTWTLNLSQLSGGGNTMVRTGTTVTVCNATYGCFTGVMTW